MDKFLSSWFHLKKKFNISTTNKIHIILDHLEDYFCKTDMTLLKTSEEVEDSMHQAIYKRLMKGYNIKHITNPNRGKS